MVVQLQVEALKVVWNPPGQDAGARQNSSGLISDRLSGWKSFDTIS